jgi:hypothetical protein
VGPASITRSMRDAVAARARGCCEYCGLADDTTLAPHEPDHIIGEQHRGETTLANLAYACFRCNRFKGPNIATVDPTTGILVPLFNPRADRWSDHFVLDGATIMALTPIGRGTEALRAELSRQRRYEPPG